MASDPVYIKFPYWKSAEENSPVKWVAMISIGIPSDKVSDISSVHSVHSVQVDISCITIPTAIVNNLEKSIRSFNYHMRNSRLDRVDRIDHH